MFTLLLSQLIPGSILLSLWAPLAKSIHGADAALAGCYCGRNGTNVIVGVWKCRDSFTDGEGSVRYFAGDEQDNYRFPECPWLAVQFKASTGTIKSVLHEPRMYERF